MFPPHAAPLRVIRPEPGAPRRDQVRYAAEGSRRAAEQAGTFRSVHALPLRLRREAIGALNLFHRNPGPLPEADLLLGQALGPDRRHDPGRGAGGPAAGRAGPAGSLVGGVRQRRGPPRPVPVVPEGPDQGVDHVTQPGLAPDADGQHLRTCQAAAPLRDQQCGLDAR